MRRTLVALLATAGALTANAADLPLPPPPPLPAASLPTLSADTDNINNNDFPVLPPFSAASDSILPPLPGIDQSPATPPVVAANNNSYAAEVGGTPGTIVGGRVHIRAGDNTKYEIIRTADAGLPVRVFEQKGDWLQIAFPTDDSCFIEQRAIDGDVPLDLPEGGVPRAIRGDAKVYVRSWSGSTSVGELHVGDSVVVTGTRGNFLRIKPPLTARAWVFAKYVKYDDAEVVKVPLTAEEQAAKEKEEQLKAALEKVKTDGAPATKSKMLSARQSDPLLAKLRERSAAERQAREQQKQAVENMLANVDQTLAAIDAETTARISDIERQKIDAARYAEEQRRAIEENYRPDAPPGTLANSVSGWVEHVGYWRNRPAEFRLVKGAETVCYLRSNRYNLADYNGRNVVVGGVTTPAPRSPARILQVESLRLFDNPNLETPRVQPAPLSAPAPDYPPAVIEPLTTAPRVVDSGYYATTSPYAPTYAPAPTTPIYIGEPAQASQTPASQTQTYIPQTYSGEDTYAPLLNNAPVTPRYQQVARQPAVVYQSSPTLAETYPAPVQNERTIIIEDNGRGVMSDHSQVGKVIDITGMPLIGQ
ncbi:hypothetical protein FACS1894139_08690 [Planctomycetales bacterium]|nr:hypothetical protein FACS1894108_01350 [Planctomycetales bacterium]GHT05232.1 hypothetical protein FACS1894139_08690 [Planctomycetales bacterium]